MLYNLYRISDAGRAKEKIAGATKINCLKNFISVFGTDGLTVFADNCSHETISEIQELGLEPIFTSLGNSGSLKYIVDFAIAYFKDNDQVYLVEDDYWHLPLAKEALLEGLQIADYVTLYNNPDKYISYNNGGHNPIITNNSEKGRIYLSKTCHWKTTNSTTMTFATHVSVLKTDKKLIWEFTQTKIPDDFELFLSLTKNLHLPFIKTKRLRKVLWKVVKNYFGVKKRVLITALPGFSTHLETAYLGPLTDWGHLIKQTQKKQLA
ncbi:hypothetical protein [Mucilaginibacter sp. FT3.2]|uniref:hypothetical protein n=1 Tax=Mucilaginibacter sp. FT3.2 TaxID=2723090 RepID=UPI001608A254|nr:hypothetical protein [Mucilaginibacter sp. FT3.2]MBB6232200.1 hypothetical protein [Mucilaginibacter sp. FT3.2]